MTKERNERFARLCRRACEIYEAEGRPHGRQEIHWQMAIEQIDAEDNVTEATPDTEIADSMLSRAVQAVEHIVAESTGGSARLKQGQKPGQKLDRRLRVGYKVRSSRN